MSKENSYVSKHPQSRLCVRRTGCSAGPATVQAQNSPVKNVVLVHGAWADGSCWKGVYDILVKDSYNVTIVQEPETTFQEDVAATKRVLALQDGSCILVAHSYGGAVITEAVPIKAFDRAFGTITGTRNLYEATRGCTLAQGSGSAS